MALGALYSSRRIWLLISLVNNLALLVFFNMRDSRRDLNAVASWLHLPLKLSILYRHAVWFRIPVAGRDLFFTFQSLSSPLIFTRQSAPRAQLSASPLLFVSFALMAGPIERAGICCRSSINSHNSPPNFTDASRFFWSVFQKMALANYLSFYVERVYDNRRHSARRPHRRYRGFRLADIFDSALHDMARAWPR